MSSTVAKIHGPSALDITSYGGPTGPMYQLTNVRNGVHEYIQLTPQEAFDMSRVFLTEARNMTSEGEAPE